jgi:hypothetical protein
MSRRAGRGEPRRERRGPKGASNRESPLRGRKRDHSDFAEATWRPRTLEADDSMFEIRGASAEAEAPRAHNKAAR